MRGVMFLRHTKRKKDGKEHRYWSIVENRRVGGGRVVQRPLLYLGEINDSQELAWRKSIAVLEEGAAAPRPLSLFPEDRCEGVLPDAAVVRLKLAELRVGPPRQWGGGWVAVYLWRGLGLRPVLAAPLAPVLAGAGGVGMGAPADPTASIVPAPNASPRAGCLLEPRPPTPAANWPICSCDRYVKAGPASWGCSQPPLLPDGRRAVSPSCRHQESRVRATAAECNSRAVPAARVARLPPRSCSGPDGPRPR